MQELMNISGQQFYYSTIDNVIESCSQKENCAIIIDENYLDGFLKDGNKIIGSNINQIIIISESVNTVHAQLEGVSVFLLSALNLKDAIKLAVLGEALINPVVFVVKEDEAVVSAVLAEMEI